MVRGRSISAALLVVLFVIPDGIASAGTELRGKWLFDKGRGIIAEDSSGNGNRGTLTNGPKWSTDTPPKETERHTFSLFFDGVNDYVNVPDAPSLEVTTFTLAAFVKAAVVSSAKVASFLGKARINGGSGYGFGLAFGLPTFGLNDGASNCGVSASQPLTAKKWTHVAGTYDSSTGTATIYINGRPDGTTSCPITALQDSAQPLNIGREFAGALTGGDGRYFHGNIDDVRIYNRALSVREIRALAL